jgi:hypothetical protein
VGVGVGVGVGARIFQTRRRKIAHAHLGGPVPA